MGQVARRTYSGLGSGLPVEVLFVRGRVVEIMFGVGKILFVRMTGEAEAFSLALYNQQQVLFYLVVVYLVARLTDDLPFPSELGPLFYQVFRYFDLAGHSVYDMKVVPLPVRGEDVLICMTFETEL